MTPARPTLDVDGLAELLAAATPGPWEAVQGASGGWWIEQPNTATIADIDCDYSGAPAEDAALIAAMRNALPDLLAHLAAVTAERDEARAAVGGLLAAVESMRVAYYSTDWRDQYTRADHLDAIVSAAAKCRAALDHVPTTEGGEG